MGKRMLVVVVMVTCVTMALATSAQAAVYPAWAGAPNQVKAAHLDFDHFFNAVTTVHVGDSVRFTIHGFHNIAFVAKGQQAPSLTTAGGSLVSGIKDAAGNPLWFNGHVPTLIINPAVALPAGGNVVTGAGYVNSGLPNPAAPKPVTFKFTKTGMFKYLCTVHPGMTGVVKVVAKSKRVPSAKQDARSAKAALATLVKRAATLAKVKPGPLRVYAGSDDNGGVTWLRFFPSSIQVKVGQAVQFVMRAPSEIHTVTFGPSAYTTSLEHTFTTPMPNPNAPPTIALDPLSAYPSDPGALPPYTGTNHGNGFENAGILAGRPSPTLPTSATFTFSKAGIYRYECVVHQGMDGTVVVKP